MPLKIHRIFFLPTTVFILSMLLFTGTAGSTFAASNTPVSELVLMRPSLTARPYAVRFSYGVGIKGMVPVRDQLRDGAHMLIEGSVSLLQNNLIRPNSELASVPVSWLLRHEPLTQDFLLFADPEFVRRGPFIDALIRETLSELHADLTLTEPLQEDQTYTLKLTLVLKYAEVPPWLKKALFFWSWDLSPVLVFERQFTLNETPAS